MKAFQETRKCIFSLRWRHNGRDGVSNHQSRDCLLNRLFRRRSKKTSKLRVTGLCEGNSPGTGEFLAQWPVTRKCFHLMTSSCFNFPDVEITQTATILPHEKHRPFYPTKQRYLVLSKEPWSSLEWIWGDHDNKIIIENIFLFLLRYLNPGKTRK